MTKSLIAMLALLFAALMPWGTAASQDSAYTQVFDRACVADENKVQTITQALLNAEAFDCGPDRFNRAADKLWIRIDVENIENAAKASHFVATLSRQGDVVLHSKAKDGTVLSTRYSSQEQAQHWHIYDAIALPIPDQSSHLSVLVLEVEAPWDPAAWGGFRLLDMKAGQSWLQHQIAIIGGVFGMLIGPIVISFGLACVYRKRFAIFFSLMLLSSSAYAFSWSGLIFELLPGMSMQARSIFNHIVVPFAVLFTCCLSYELCEEGVLSRRWKWTLIAAAMVPLTIAFLAVSAAPNWAHHGSQILHASYVVPLVTITIALIAAVRKGSRLALALLIGSAGIHLYLVSRILTGLGFAVPYFINYFGFLPAAALEVVVVTALVLLSFNRLKKEHESALIRQKLLLSVASTDPLLNIPNRRSFTENFEQALAATKSRKRTLVIALLDLDGFKAVNDTYGHAAGDELLKIAAKRLQAELPKDAFLARLGGDEFGIFMFVAGGEVEFIDICETCCLALKQSFSLAEGVARISGSVGITGARTSDKSISTLLERADYALYQSKAERAGQPVIYSDVHEHEVTRTRKIEALFMDADLEQEIEVVFQPIVASQTGEPTGMEALARWNSPRAGLVSPADFIPIAEQNGKISEITRIVLTKALEQAARWPDTISLSVNLSAIDIMSEEAALEIYQIVTAADLPPNRLIFELTESILMREFDRCQQVLSRLRKLGVRIALDDFGTGYSSLSYLRNMPIDRLKVDRSFISDIETSEVARRLLAGVVGLCDSIDIECAVEGIEREAQREIVIDQGGSIAQGFYFSRPLSARAASSYLMSKLPLKLKLTA